MFSIVQAGLPGSGGYSNRFSPVCCKFLLGEPRASKPGRENSPDRRAVQASGRQEKNEPTGRPSEGLKEGRKDSCQVSLADEEN